MVDRTKNANEERCTILCYTIPMTEQKPVAVNRKARHEYSIEETYEAGIALAGPDPGDRRPRRASGIIPVPQVSPSVGG